MGHIMGMRHFIKIQSLFAFLFLGFLALPALGTTYYVDVNSANPTPPYTDWSIAATNIQDAVNLTLSGDTVLVTNGVYQYGGIVLGGETNRVFVTNTITLSSVGGSQVTMIVGGLSTRCVLFLNNAALVGFTITGANGSIGSQFGQQIGGGVYCGIGSVVSNCFIVNNTAGTGGGIYGTGAVYNSVISGNIDSKGAVAYASLYNCMVFSNIATVEGGGLYFATASNCLIADNQANQPSSLGGIGGGGVYHSTIYNSTIMGNQGTKGGGAYQSQVYNCSILTNSGAGGGAFLSSLTNCLVSGNLGGGVNNGSSYNCIFSGNYGSQGGAGEFATFYDCLLVSNTADYGGGANNSSLFNCTVVGNVATNSGGGVFDETPYSVNNSIVYYNNAPTGPNSYSTTFYFSCSTPATSGVITNEPVFVNMAGGDFHLQSNSPCINSGNNAYVSTATDLDGNPRVQGGTVDIGAYEYQTPVSMVSYQWLEQYGLPITTNIDTLDLDGSGFDVYQDWVAGLNPTNPASVLVMMPVTTTNSTAGIKVTWQSVSGVNYFLQRTTNLPIPFSTIQSNIVGQPGTTSYSDTSATNGTPYFYRVGVQAP